MFEAIVILLYLIWAGIIMLFLGFVSTLFFICIVFSAMLLGGALLLVQVDSVFAGVPLAIYSAIFLGAAILVKIFSHPTALRSFVRDAANRLRAKKQNFPDNVAP
jgi:hypothetical protein